MIEIFNKNDLLQIKSENNLIYIDIIKKEIKIGDYLVNFPGEYEKSGILLEIKEFENKLFYSFLIEQKVVFVLFEDNFEQKEEIMSFFGDIDILLVTGTKEAVKIVENIESRVIIPFGDAKDIFLNTLGQHKEEVENFKLKQEIGIENTEFINLK
ncbi:hypothetical protein H3C61_00040 [Candidatus Gracilibacteria bacterium]|nr:hypothetical protein [Candidatus Gracilibacteria bacterium]